MNDDLPLPMPTLGTADGLMATRLAMRGLPQHRHDPRKRTTQAERHHSLFGPPQPPTQWREHASRIYATTKLAVGAAVPLALVLFGGAVQLLNPADPTA
jgi:hypothetical protein